MRGAFAPADGYLAGLRRLTATHGALLIVDEVMTGFRVGAGRRVRAVFARSGPGDAGQDCGRRVAGGVFGGKREFMDLLAPLGPVYQAGTLSGNPLAMAAGIATVELFAGACA